MKHILTLLAAGALALVPAGAQTLKVATVDMVALLNGYYKTQQANERIGGQAQSVDKAFAPMQEEYNALVTQAKDLNDKVGSAAISEEARGQAQADLQGAVGLIRQKENEMQQFLRENQEILQNQQRSARANLIDEIRKVVADYARGKSVQLVLESSGAGLGIPVAVYTDPTWDVTREIMAILNKDAPAGTLNPDGTAIQYRGPQAPAAAAPTDSAAPAGN